LLRYALYYSEKNAPKRVKSDDFEDGTTLKAYFPSINPRLPKISSHFL